MQIGIITNDRHNIFQRLVIAGVEAIAAETDVTVRIDSQHDRQHGDVRLSPADVDGFIVIANSAPDSFLESVQVAGRPLSLVSHRVTRPFPSVFFNNAQGMRELMAHLVARCGYRQPLFIRGVPDQTDAIEREEAYRLELLRHNLNINEGLFLNGAFEPEVAAQAIREALRDGLAFDAVVSADYMMALASIRELEAAGRNVPGDVAVVGFGDALEAATGGLTTVSANVEELGQCAALQLLAQMHGRRIQGKTLLSVEIVVRDSTCVA